MPISRQTLSRVENQGSIQAVIMVLIDIIDLFKCEHGAA